VGKFEGLLNMTNQATQEKTLSPQEVRAILNTDNKEIIELCKQASIMPRKNNKGVTYFSYEEVKNLRRIQAMRKASTIRVEAPALQQSSNVAATAGFQSILSSIKSMEDTLSDKIAKVINEKLEGMDEVVVELIRCKTDNETLRQKIVDLNKEVYQLKNKLNCYKPVALGLYVKKDQHIWE
jgi:hypothetical protein